MVSSVFKILVTAIVAIAILSIFFNQFAELFFVKGNVIEEMKSALISSEQNQGKLIHKEINFVKGGSIIGKNLDAPARGVTFKCLDPITCCTKEQSNCKILVNPRNARPLITAISKTYYRCEYEVNINVCTIYFGKKPAQIEYLNINAPSQVNIGEKEAQVKIRLKNSGDFKAENVLTKAKIYVVSSTLDDITKNLYYEPTPYLIKELGPGETQQFDFNLHIKDPGNYVVELKTEAEDSGFDFREFDLKTIGRLETGCKATMPLDAFEDEGSYYAKYGCEGCEYNFECAIAWMNKGIQEDKIVARYPTHIKAEIPSWKMTQILDEIAQGS